MKSRNVVLLAGALVAGLSLSPIAAYADGGEGCGWKKNGHGHGKMSMMRHGGMGFMGMNERDRDFTTDEIRTLASAFLLMKGNDNLKVGKITTTDQESYLVQIVTKEDSLVHEVELSKRTGHPVKWENRQGKKQ